MIEPRERKTGRRTAKGKARHPAPAGGPERRAPLPPEERRRMIAEAAYYRALHRGFAGGSQDQDWRDAEAEIDALLLRDHKSRS